MMNDPKKLKILLVLVVVFGVFVSGYLVYRYNQLRANIFIYVENVENSKSQEELDDATSVILQNSKTLLHANDSSALFGARRKACRAAGGTWNYDLGGCEVSGSDSEGEEGSYIINTGPSWRFW